MDGRAVGSCSLAGLGREGVGNLALAIAIGLLLLLDVVGVDARRRHDAIPEAQLPGSHEGVTVRQALPSTPGLAANVSSCRRCATQRPRTSLHSFNTFTLCAAAAAAAARAPSATWVNPAMTTAVTRPLSSPSPRYGRWQPRT